MVAVQRIRSLANFKTATRHWVPITRTAYSRAHFSSRRISSNNDAQLVSNDDAFPVIKSGVSTKKESQINNNNNSNNETEHYFEPVIYSSEEVLTASAAKKY
ncbi:uncharacterized protein SPAPADRAFT_59190 [Spathaspora passalidarum NRRL Y-27907]|uniref:Uncharacterized protein n=1 Tax=Spathaspora passalidarum (strain NRRL Y-27907 / 11-Y1) TaxID=619300 RepID=G3AJ73_SPAPN|nr:uncharacterized protein SPAPADRAFT_59190 [Spathaspora passalidarum NRRL Y-27907]EGW33831.1 hypothetical protein SPAPADRAFT_59190 [Spathaspora passalidarum NRRL Y-27907]